ncbi:ABC-type oligopeptide transport system, periplasmic component [Raoultella terrigena]|uniref:ABC-type oligopeptide transport system, periplasmic component n=1 Tax=Raoultella terrigena TaxID=577 RepID=A0A3P8KT37_RAOTE|nr:ABC-type oligopeptide transport system, periplasmic component [Raoultella terrigena]
MRRTSSPLTLSRSEERRRNSPARPARAPGVGLRGEQVAPGAGAGWKNRALPLGQIITSTLLGHEPFDPYATTDSKGDPEKAKALLKEAGLADGLTLDLVYRANNQFSTLAVILKEDLARSGIRLNLIPVPPPQFMPYLQSPENRWDLALGQTSPDWQGPATRMLLGGWLNSDASPCGPRQRLRHLLQQRQAEPVSEAGLRLDNPGPIWQEADRLVSADLPWIPLFEKRRIAVTSERVTNWTWSSLATQADITNIALKP